jgi:hypothetical protein
MRPTCPASGSQYQTPIPLNFNRVIPLPPLHFALLRSSSKNLASHGSHPRHCSEHFAPLRLLQPPLPFAQESVIWQWWILPLVSSSSMRLDVGAWSRLSCKCERMFLFNCA